MASWRRFQPRSVFDEPGNDRGTKGERPCGLAVQRCRGNPRAECEERASALTESSGVDTQEKFSGENTDRPYRKPTQVGEARSLR
jgi:hypothetical protein